MTQVVVIQRVLTHYRVPFFEEVRRHLETSDVDLRLIAGQPRKRELARNDSGQLPWSEECRNCYFKIGSRDIVWQSCLRCLRGADLVIVEQASKLLLNYLLLIWRFFGGPKVAFWGHGNNLDVAAASRVGEFVKRRLAKRADWWFCYTSGTAEIVKSLGVNPMKITVVQNAVDTTSVRQWRESVTDEEKNALRHALGIGSGPVAIYLGSLYPTKRPQFLMAAADRIRSEIPDFELIVIGDGPDRNLVDQAARTRTWIHPVGTQTGREMVTHASLGSIMLNPGLVGLGVLDSFALGVPMVTCEQTGHGPEIEYLTNGLNGIMLSESTTPPEYASAVVSLLRDRGKLQRLSQVALSCAGNFTVEEMVRRFASGLKEVLELPSGVSVSQGIA